MSIVLCPQRSTPLLQTYGVLFIGQGFSSTELAAKANSMVDTVLMTPPFTGTGPLGPQSGRIAFYADDGAGLDLGFKAPVKATAPGVLGLPDGGVKLQAALESIELPAARGSGSAPQKASSYWGIFDDSGPSSGRTAKLVVVLRKPANADNSGAFYRLPVVAVDAVTDPAWQSLVLRAMAQSLAGLADEFWHSGPAWNKPPDEVKRPGPDLPIVPHQLGTNVILIDNAQRSRLGTERIEQTVPGIDPVWHDPSAGPTTPHRGLRGHPEVHGDDPAATIRVVEGAGGYRVGVLRCDRPCLMAQVPPGVADPPLPADGWEPVGRPSVGLCPVCEKLVAAALGASRATTESPPRWLDRQASEYRAAGFPERTRRPLTAGVPMVELVDELIDGGARWAFHAVVNQDGLTIRQLGLHDRPGDPMASSPDIAEQITYGDFSYDTGGGPQVLRIADAMANTEVPPRFEVGRSPLGLARVGVSLTVTWLSVPGILIQAELSLTCRTIRNDFDPGGAAEACKFYPQITFTWERSDPQAPSVRSISGTVTISANNRITSMDGMDMGGDGGMGGMEMDAQSVMLLVDGNNTKRDAGVGLDSRTVIVPGPTGPVSLPVPVGRWTSGRLLAAVTQPVPFQAYLAWMIGKAPILPHWSWLFDYGRQAPLGTTGLSETVVWEQVGTDAPDARGTSQRTSSAIPWPLHPSADLGGTPAMSVTKVPRQGSYDNIHVNADMGVDSQGRPLIAAPFCADLCLHLHVRWGIDAITAAKPEVRPHFMGWSDGRWSRSSSLIGAPLVPPNQRIRFRVRRADNRRTDISYAATVYGPRERRAQVILEQGLGFAFTYNGLSDVDRSLLMGPFRPAVQDIPRIISRDDITIRNWFRAIYETIRWHDVGYAGTEAPQQIPADVHTGPWGPGGASYQALEEL